MTIVSAASQRCHEFLQPAAAAAETVPPMRGALALAAADPPHGRVLVVEPHAVIALDLQRILRDAGYRIVGPATSAAEAARLLRRGRVDCALLDLDSKPDELSAAADLLDAAGVPYVVLGAEPGARRGPTVAKPYLQADLLQAIESAIAGESEQLPPPPSSTVPRVPWPRVFPSL